MILPSSIRSLLLRAASVAMIGFGAVLLLADGSECPDGYVEQTYNASFTSDCPAAFAPAQGTLHLKLPGSIVEQLQTAGFGTVTTQKMEDATGDKCSVTSFTISSSVDPDKLSVSCGGIVVGKEDQTVTCSGRALKPLILQFGIRWRALGDASIDDASVGDASSSDDAGRDDASSTSTPDSGGSYPVPRPSSSGPAMGTQPVTCTLHFKKI